MLSATEKLEKFIYKHKKLIETNPEKAKKIMTKIIKQNVLNMGRLTYELVYLLKTDKSFIELFPELQDTKYHFAAVHIIREAPELISLFPQFKNDQKFYIDLIASREELEDDEGVFYSPIRYTFYSNLYQLVPEDIAKSKEFLKDLFKCSYEADTIYATDSTPTKGYFTNVPSDVGFKYFGKKSLEQAVKVAKEFIKETLENDSDIDGERSLKRLYNMFLEQKLEDFIPNVFDDLLLKDIKDIFIKKAHEKVDVIREETDRDDIHATSLQKSIEELDKIQEKLNKNLAAVNNIEKKRDELVNAKGEFLNKLENFDVGIEA